MKRFVLVPAPTPFLARDRMASSFEMREGARQLSEDAHALWTEAASLTPLAKWQPGSAPHLLVRLTRKSAEVCRLAQVIHEMVSDHRTRSRPARPRHPQEPDERLAKLGRV
jgi:hypothetical protein